MRRCRIRKRNVRAWRRSFRASMRPRSPRRESATMSESLRRRLDRVRSRVAVRSWEYRQRHLSHGVWFRVRHILAYASRAYVIPEAEVPKLLAEGYEAEPVGGELEPEKLLIFLPAARAEAIPGAREIAVRLSAPFLEAHAVALVRFDV